MDEQGFDGGQGTGQVPEYPQQPVSPQVPPSPPVAGRSTPDGQGRQFQPGPTGTPEGPPGQGYPPAGGQYAPQGPPAGGPPYDLPPQKSGGMSRRNKVVLSVVVVFLVLAGLLVAGVVIDRVFYSSSKADQFSLEASPVYQETLFNIKNYFYRDYSEAKIKAAANLAVEKAKKKGVKDTDELLNTGLDALVNALGDPHSNYLSPEENKRLAQDLSGSFYGVGFTLRTDKASKRPKVVTVIKGSPSEKAGIKANDTIMSVDGKDTKGEALDSVVLRIRGKKGTKVKLKVERDGKPMEFTITREKISIPDFESEIVDGNIGVLRLLEFDSGVSEKVRAAVKDMQAKGVKGFILDMRNDPGGLLDEAVKVTSIFSNQGPVVSYQTKGRDKVTENASGNAETSLPLVVLTNGGSASASEITAGALKDNGRAVLVGSKTYGKGSVQKVFELSNQGAAKLTIALYYLPNGESIDGKGIQPDVVVDEIKDDPTTTEKLQLDKAKEVLNNLLQGKPATGELILLAA
jgi:carboxyl-terminal processing protease